MKIIHYDYLNDKDFLRRIDKYPNKEQFVKITTLSWNEENPIGEIQGKTSTGSENLNGESSSRRTCNLTVIADSKVYNILDVNNLISINKKIAVAIGFKNPFPWEYPDEFIWFHQGVFIITKPSVSYNNSGLTISLQLEDKMALLNGSVGGFIPAATTFDSINEYDKDGNLTITRTLIYDIIRKLVHEFGGEDYSRIIINDIDNRIKKVMKWVGEQDLELVNKSNNEYEFRVAEEGYNPNSTYYSYGQDVGYEYEDFYYPSDLSCNPGDTVTSILDKIKDSLGNFEYFYDIYGNFIFQEIKNYLNTSKATEDLKKLENTDYLIDRAKGKSVYEFTDKIITSYSNNPSYKDIKNDFIIWGKRNLSSGETMPIHYHLAIDTKPVTNNLYYIVVHKNSITGIDSAKVLPDTSVIFLEEGESLSGQDTSPYYVRKEKIDVSTEEGQNQIEEKFVYYVWNDEIGRFFRYVYNEDENGLIYDAPILVRTHDWREDLYFKGILAQVYNKESSNFYYKEMSEYWPKIFNIISKKEEGNAESGLPIFNGEYKGTTQLDYEFFIDFIDSNEKISELSVQNIGRRTLVVSDDSINCVFAPAPADFVIIESNQDDTEVIRQECQRKNQKYIQVDESIYSALATGGASNSAFEYIRGLLYKYTSYNEEISFSAIPIYYLEPNTRITVNNREAGISGDYMIKTISLPFDINGTMNVSCTKALEKL